MAYKKIALVVGHSKLIDGTTTSANGIKNEYEINKVIANKISGFLKAAGQDHDLIQIPEYYLNSAKEEKGYKIPILNSGSYDFVVEIHCNCYNKLASGTEVLYYPGNKANAAAAQKIQDKTKTIFNDRGIKARDDLYILRDTKPLSLIVECFFIDNKEDCGKFDTYGAAVIGKLIAEGILGSDIKDNTIKEVFAFGQVTSNLNLRSAPNENAKIYTTIPKNDKLAVCNRVNENWYSVFYNDKKGYAHKNYIVLK